MSLEIYPYVKTDNGWSISDSVMGAIWLQLEQEGKVEHLFYDGSVRDLSGWLAHIKKPEMFPAVVADYNKGIPVHIVWLNGVADGVAWAHHTSLGRYRRGVWEKVVQYWSLSPLRILLGLTPETNEIAIKFLKKICKFKVVGTIPEICNMVYEDRRVGGVVSYYQLVKESEKWVEKEVAVRAVAAAQ